VAAFGRPGFAIRARGGRLTVLGLKGRVVGMDAIDVGIGYWAIVVGTGSVGTTVSGADKDIGS
jgi:hypothetical protein